jgi:uncharacterized membrane protein YphA (DoxX/SURF4 family)
MNIVLWILQVLVALAFLMHGLGMLKPSAEARPGMSYIQDLPSGLRIFIGVMEILGAIGLVLPPLVNVLPVLTPIAAAGLVIIMVLAIGYHVTRRENPNIVLNLVLAVLALFVAYGRFVLLPF